MWAVAFLLFGQSSSAWTGGRPPECAEPSGRTSNVWERAKAPELGRYCDLVASASSKLAGVAATAAAALGAAREAEALLPAKAAPFVLEGRALADLGRYDEAVAAFSEGSRRDARALDDPPALLAWARALARTGRHEEAADAYRSLLPRAGVLSTTTRVSAEIEAGLVAMQRGERGLDEAAAALREAVHEAQDEAQAVAALGLALALDRAGGSREARALLADRLHGDPRETLSTPRAKDLLAVVPAETHAMTALALEPSDGAGAREEWQRSIDDAPRGPWTSYAREHLAALGGKRSAGAGR
jgi:tetratricopeptide (TPR) repeat protein